MAKLEFEHHKTYFSWLLYPNTLRQIFLEIAWQNWQFKFAYLTTGTLCTVAVCTWNFWSPNWKTHDAGQIVGSLAVLPILNRNDSSPKRFPTSVPSWSFPVSTTFSAICEKWDFWNLTDSKRTRELGEIFNHLYWYDMRGLDQELDDKKSIIKGNLMKNPMKRTRW